MLRCSTISENIHMLFGFHRGRGTKNLELGLTKTPWGSLPCLREYF